MDTAPAATDTSSNVNTVIFGNRKLDDEERVRKLTAGITPSNHRAVG